MLDDITFDFEHNDYLYHDTNLDAAIRIYDEGLLIDGNNILDADKIIETTTLPIEEDSNENLSKFFMNEFSTSLFRKIDAIVLIGIPKEYEKEVLEENYIQEYGYEYNYVLPNRYIMGYIDLTEGKFIKNMDYQGY